MCKHNKFVAQQFGFPDIAQCWSLAELIATTNDTETDDDMFFNQIPFPKNILESVYVVASAPSTLLFIICTQLCLS